MNTESWSSYIRMAEIFDEKQWPIKQSNKQDTHRLKRFFEMFAELSESEIELIFNLVSRFEHYDTAKYPSLMNKVLDKGFQFKPDFWKSNDIVVLPLNSPRHRHKNKSGNSVAYQVASRLEEYLHKPIHCLALADGLPAIRAAASGDLSILFADDYIGTGESAIDAISYYNPKWSISTDSIMVLCYVGLERGMNALKGKGIEVHAAEVRKRGISDYIGGSELPKVLQTMREIERKLKINNNQRLGYLSSEGLEAMARTPDNTFPVFWATEKIDGSRWPAPFPRYP